MILVQLVRPRRRNHELRQVDTGITHGSGATGKCSIRISIVISRHATVAIHRNTQRHVAGNHFVVAELGNEIVFRAVAVVFAIQATTWAAYVAVDRGFTLRAEIIDAGIPAIADQHHVGRVDGSSHRVLAVGNADTAHALGLHAVAVGEIAVGGKSRAGQAGKGDECCDFFQFHCEASLESMNFNEL